MTIDSGTLVVKAWRSRPQAADIFRRHNVDPGCDCAVGRDNTPSEDAEEGCGLKDLAGLIRELNAVPRRAG